MNIACVYGGLFEYFFFLKKKRLITFEVDGVSTFQGAKLGVIVHIIQKNDGCPLHCTLRQSHCPNPF